MGVSQGPVGNSSELGEKRERDEGSPKGLAKESPVRTRGEDPLGKEGGKNMV